MSTSRCRENFSSSITGLQQQIKAAFGRWRKRGTSSSSHNGLEEEAVSGSSSHRIREDCFDHPLNVRLSAQSQTFSHPHRLTVFPPFPSGLSTSSSNTSGNNNNNNNYNDSTNRATSPTTSTGGGGGKSAGQKSGSSSGGSSHPFSFVRGLHRKRREGSESSTQRHHLTDPSSDRVRSRTADTTGCGSSGWSTLTRGGQEFTGSYPLASKSRSDHSLHRILKDDNTWTVFATLRPPSDKGGSLSKGSTAWTFGLFSDSPSHHPQRRQASSTSVSGRSKSKAASVAPSPEILHRSFNSTTTTGAATPSAFLPGFLCRNERRTRSLERCFQQRVHHSGTPTTTNSGSSGGYHHHHHQQQQQHHHGSVPPSQPPPVPSRVRSRSLEKNYTLSTTAAPSIANSGGGVGGGGGGLRVALGTHPVSPSTPLLPVRRNNNVPPEVLATWCTFNEAFGGGRPRHRPPLVEPLTVEANDERDSPGSPVFEELFLPPPQRFSCSSGGTSAAVVTLSSASSPATTTTLFNTCNNELVINNNNNNKRNSVAGSCCCSCGGSAGHSIGASCSSRSTPRSSPIPPPVPSSSGGNNSAGPLPETVLYGSREAPVLERHCVEGGEFIIAWLSHSKTTGSGSSSANNSTAPTHRPAPSTPSQPPPTPLTAVAAAAPLTASSNLSVDMHSSSSSGAASAAVASSSSSTASSNRSFINKPARGWLHSDTVIVRDGITYFVRYIGCLEVNTSMKSLDFDTRSQIAKECINIVCETAGLKTIDKKRKVDRRIQRILGDAPHMEHAGSDVALTISSGCLRISTLEGSHVVACHDMPNISFASGGDPDTLDFVAYVAKDDIHGRACYVLECGGGLAQDVITTIGQAFELRFKEYLKRTPRSLNESVIDGNSAAAQPPPWSPDDPEYYNDLPGKVPPDVGPPPVPPLPNYQAPAGTVLQSSSSAAAGTLKKAVSDRSRPAVDLSDNLIDLNADVSQMARPDAVVVASSSSAASSTGTTGLMPGAAALPAPFPDHEYVNGIMGSSSDFKNTPANKDPFDMHPFSAALPSPLPSALLAPNSGSLASGGGSRQQAVVTLQRGGTKAGKARTTPMEAQLSQEIWFHGPISRKEAEDLLKQDGDFLVRESQGSPGQYVLTGMQSGHHKHLLLVDPEGVVRTKDRTFESVSHLINFHRNNVLPIISAESVLLLKKPVSRAHHS
uniref:EOG090X098F n=1 Tax=Scapholeberis mucronata TaxID=202097 RepID=A0A4Y7NKH1_9CRUS|nr:EOG090X098F [Scapholeberis mucronata]SVE93729.1 EOG090X098F [Scapholeberis mucronata]